MILSAVLDAWKLLYKYIVLLLALACFVVSASSLWAGEWVVNTYTAGEQSNPSIAMNPNGDFVSVWQSWAQDGDGYGIYAQRYNSADEPQGPEFRVNSYTKGNQKSPAIAMDKSGNFIIVWQSSGQNGPGVDIYARIFDREGRLKVDEFLVNAPSAASKYSPSVAMDANGDFVIVWQSWAETTDAFGIFARRFLADGTPAGDESLVSNFSAYSQYAPDVAMNAVGTFIVIWQRYDGQGHNLYGRVFDSRGKIRGNTLDLNKIVNNEVVRASVAMNSKGAFVVTWQQSSMGKDNYKDGLLERNVNEIYAVSYNERLAPESGPFQLNINTGGFQHSPDAAMDSNGDFIIVWQSWNQNGDSSGIFTRKFSLDGQGKGGEFQVNTVAKDIQSLPSVAMDDSGKFTAVWQSWSRDGSGNGILARSFNAGITGPELLSVRITASEDDAEERASTGEVDLSSTDLELLYDGAIEDYQHVGLHFKNIQIPKGAVIHAAQVQFMTNKRSRGMTTVKIYGEDSDNANSFKALTRNISSRPLTSASVTWFPVAWVVKDESNADQRTPDIASIIQEIIDRPGWSKGNSINLIFPFVSQQLMVSGAGFEPRIAQAYDGNDEGSPIIQIEYSVP